jgi:macrolide transport system ATP-binding/permease protein
MSVGDQIRGLRLAARQLARTPGFTLPGIIVLALGLCASVSIFTFVDAALIRPLPYASPGRLITIFGAVPTCPRCRLSYLDYLDFKRFNRFSSSFEAFRNTGFIVAAGGDRESVPGARVSAGFFKALGVRPEIGQDFAANEDQADAGHSVLLSHELWQHRYGARLDVVGRSVTLDAKPYVVVGVLPADFHFAPAGPADYWAPLDPTEYCAQRRGCHNLTVVARLKDGVSVGAASAEAALISGQLERQYPESNRGQGTVVVPLTDVILGDIRPVLLALLGGAAMLLLIGSVNVTSLLLIRSDNRRHEMAVRSALGASRGRLIRQFVTEGALLVTAAGVLGVASAEWAMRFLSRLIPPDMMVRLPFLHGLGLNLHATVFALALALGAALLFGAVPGARVPVSAIEADLRGGSRGAAPRTWRRLGSKLVVLELATAAVMLVAASLLGQSVYRLLHVDLGFEPRNITTLTVAFPGARSAAEITGLARHIVDAISSLPSVQAVGHTSSLPVTANGNTEWIRLVGHPYYGEHNEVNERWVSAGYLPALGATLWRGRLFTDAETADSPRVTIINRTLATRYFHDEDPIGKQLGGIDLSPDSIRTIVGVVNDIREGALDSDVWPAEYLPFNQRPRPGFSLVVRSPAAGQPVLPAIMAVIRAIDPGSALKGGTLIQDQISDSPSAYMHRSLAFVSASFAAVALVLSVIGLYGVVAYSVSQRTREIGIRMALGAERKTMYVMVLGEAGWLAAIGIGVGVAGAVVVAAFMRTLLFGVQSWDPATLSAVGAVLAGAALVASYIPARRAASVNPIEALRAE